MMKEQDESESAKAIGPNLLAWRHSQKLNKRKAAAKLDVDPSTYGKWENGKVTPDPKSLAHIETMGGPPPSVLLTPRGRRLESPKTGSIRFRKDKESTDRIAVVATAEADRLATLEQLINRRFDELMEFLESKIET